MRNSSKVKGLFGENSQFLQERKGYFDSSDSNFEEGKEEKRARNVKAGGGSETNKQAFDR
jgi:hypothetical protein